MCRESAPRNKRSAKTCDTGQSDADSKDSLDAMHVRNDNTGKLLRREHISKFRGTPGDHQGRAHRRCGEGQLGDQLVDEGCLSCLRSEGASNCLKDYETDVG